MQNINRKITTIRLLCALGDDEAKLLNMGHEVLGFRVLVA
jgi:hypothetical protein